MSYIYSTTPLPDVDTLNVHTGFYIITFALIVGFIVMCFNEDDVIDRIIMGSIFSCIIAVSGWISWNTGEIRHYVNEPVIARMHSNEPQVVAYTERVHKNNVTKYRLQSFVYYEVDGGVVAFQRGDGQSWPITATLYRNPAK